MSANFLCFVALLVGVDRFQNALHYVATAGFRCQVTIDLRRISQVVHCLARLPSLACVRRSPEVDLLR
jgi:hypothetical protein